MVVGAGTFFGLGIWIIRLGGRDLKANAVVDVRISLICVVYDSLAPTFHYHLHFGLVD